MNDIDNACCCCSASKMYAELIGSFGGILTGYAYTYSRQFPRNKQYAVIGAMVLGGIAFAKTVEYVVERRATTRQRFVEEYVRRNPEQFPEQPTFKFKEKFLPWKPAR